MVGSKVEAGGIAKDGAKLVAAVSNANVPKFTVVIGGSLVPATMACATGFGPRMMWMWPNARISVMGGPQAAGVLRTVKDALEAAGEPPLSEEVRVRSPTPCCRSTRPKAAHGLLRAAVG